MSVTCDKLVVFSGNPVSSTSKTDRYNITEILWKVAFSTIKPNQTSPHSTFIAMFWLSVLIVIVILPVRYFQYCLLLITNILQQLFLGCITRWWLLYWCTCPVCRRRRINNKELAGITTQNSNIKTKWYSSKSFQWISFSTISQTEFKRGVSMEFLLSSRSDCTSEYSQKKYWHFIPSTGSEIWKIIC